MFLKYVMISLCLLCAFVFTGCSVNIPVFTPDDKNVSALVSDYMSDINDISIDFEGSMQFESAAGFNHVITKSSYIYGDVSNIMAGNSHVKDVNSESTYEHQSEWYLDVTSDVFYENVDSSDWICYRNGTSVYDFSWWHDIVSNIDLKYSGEVTLDDKKVYLLDRTYSGSDLEMLLRHLHIMWNADLAQSDMTLSMYGDRWSGKPIEMVISFAESGMPIVVNNDGVNETLTDFNYTFRFDMTSSDDVVLPNIESDDLRDYVGSAIGSTSVQSDCLLLNSYLVNFVKNDIFDDVSVDYNLAVIDAKSSLNVTGLPDVHIFVKDGLDAHTVITSDRSTTYDFYKASELSEIDISDVVQFSLDGRESYMYSYQYTDVDNNFNNVSYEICVVLDDTTYVKIIMTSITDRGVNTMLTDTYAMSILKQLSISGGEGGDDNE